MEAAIDLGLDDPGDAVRVAPAGTVVVVFIVAVVTAAIGCADAHEHTSRAERETRIAVWVPQAPITQPIAEFTITEFAEDEQAQARSVF